MANEVELLSNETDNACCSKTSRESHHSDKTKSCAVERIQAGEHDVIEELLITVNKLMR